MRSAAKKPAGPPSGPSGIPGEGDSYAGAGHLDVVDRHVLPKDADAGLREVERVRVLDLQVADDDVAGFTVDRQDRVVDAGVLASLARHVLAVRQDGRLAVAVGPEDDRLTGGAAALEPEAALAVVGRAALQQNSVSRLEADVVRIPVHVVERTPGRNLAAPVVAARA